MSKEAKGPVTNQGEVGYDPAFYDQFVNALSEGDGRVRPKLGNEQLASIAAVVEADPNVAIIGDISEIPGARLVPVYSRSV
ncbi:MAG: hypothetical protein WCJ70_02585 [bacterium]